MQVFGGGSQTCDEGQVYSIDLWFSKRRQLWIVERLDSNGNVIGAVHQCSDEDDAHTCLRDWLRAHADTHSFSKDDGSESQRPLRHKAA